MPAYYHDTPIDVPDGSWVRFDSDSGGTPAAVFSRAGQPIANSVVFSQTGSVQRVLSDSATLYLRLSSQAGVARSGVVAQTAGVAFTSFDSDSDVTGRGGAGGGSVDLSSYKTAAQSDATYAPIAQAVNPNDVGYDLILLLGQSNMAGRGITIDATRFDIADPRVFQYGNPTPALSYSGVISAAVEPLLHRDGATAVGPGFPFARRYAQTVPTNRRVLLVPCAHGGTPLLPTNQLSWNSTIAPGTNGLYQAALSTAQAALARAGTNARIVAALWHQGETDGETGGVTQTAYAAALDALVVKLRTDLGIADLPFVVGQMVPDYIGLNQRPGVNAAHIDTPRRLTRTGFGYGPLGSAYNNGDQLHYSAVGQRGPVATGLQSLSHAMWDGYRRAVTNVTGTAPIAPAAPTITQTSATAVAVTWAQPSGRVTGFVVEQNTGGGWTTVTRAATLIDAAQAITGITGGATVQVRVSTVNEQATSAPSPAASLTLLVVPAQVTGLAAGTATATQQPLSWTAVTGAASYVVEQSVDAGTTWTASVTSPSLVTSNTATVTGLTPSTSYRFRVSAANVAGTGTASTTVTASTAASTSPLTTAGVTAYRAYGPRKQRDAWTGAAMKVRRSSDNTTQDIGFTGGGDLDATALLAFVGAGDGYVDTLYDQSGSGFHLQQATTTAQYRIALAGVVDTAGGKPALFSAGAAYFPDSTNLGLYAQAGVTVCAVFKFAQPASTTVALVAESSTTTASPRYMIYGSSVDTFLRVQIRNDANTGLATLTGTVAALNNVANQYSFLDSTTNVSQFVNGAASGSAAYSTARTGTLTPTRFSVGTFFNGTTAAAGFLTGYLSELIIVGSALATGTRQAIEANQKSYYGTP